MAIRKIKYVDTVILCGYLISLHSALREMFDDETFKKIHQLTSKHFKSAKLNIDEVNEKLYEFNKKFYLSKDLSMMPRQPALIVDSYDEPKEE